MLGAYSNLSRWEKNAAFLLLQSLAWGLLTEQTDAYPWEKMRRSLGLPKLRTGKGGAK